MGFNVVTLAITVRTDDFQTLATKLPLSGNVFSDISRRLCCRSSGVECKYCSTRLSCSWQILFGQVLTSDIDALRRHQKPPLPFVFTFPQPGLNPKNVNEFTCDLTVIGTAIPHIYLLIQAFCELLSNGMNDHAAEIVAVSCRDFQGNLQNSSGCSRFDGLVPLDLTIVSTEDIQRSFEWGKNEIRLHLTSPLRLVEDGRPQTHFNFSRFARSVMRRASSLSFYYGESGFDWEFKELTRLIDEVVCIEDRFRFFKHKNLQLSGNVGSGCFVGDFSRIGPVLSIGSYVHTGKGASYGLGAYNITSAQ